MNNTVYTIGHSTHSQDYFLRLLQHHSISVVADVRSVPYSPFHPQYNRDPLHSFLKYNNIKYVFLGKEFGARTENSECYVQGQVQYDKIANTQDFQEGLQRIKKGVARYTIALMCSEKDPLECHRTILVARYIIEKLGFDIQHIMANGDLKSQKDILEPLTHDLFHTIEYAYKKQESKIAYKQSSPIVDKK